MEAQPGDDALGEISPESSRYTIDRIPFSIDPLPVTMSSPPEIDGQVLTYEKYQPQGRAKKIIHVNGVMSPIAKQKRDLEALVWLTMETPLDAIAVHNSTQGFQNDIAESLLGKAELYSTWGGRNPQDSIQRFRAYADLLRPVIEKKLTT